MPNGLPAGDTLIRVIWSGLNYKDALAVHANPAVVKTLPHIPGIDAAGIVVETTAPHLSVGQAVVVTGWDFGAGSWGSFAEYARLPGAWAIPLPSGLSLRESMIFGTAGFTAAQCVAALRKHDVLPDGGDVLVTGANGGVGSTAIAVLAKLGYRVTAGTGKSPERALALGAVTTLIREELADASDRPLLKPRWTGAIDTVGGTTLGTILRSTAYRGCVAACGLVGGADLPTSVFPFILRGVSLIGIDSVNAPAAERAEIWNRLAGDWKPRDIDALAGCEIGLDDLPEQIEKILRGETTGRVLVKIGDE
ncbi:MAG: YhdH/YhfP family quinone oxidoreductase [Pirellulales bacterium]